MLNATLILWFLQSCISFRLVLVYLSHIWHVSKQMSPWFCLCLMNSVLSLRSWLAWFLRKMPLTMNNQLLAWWMRNVCKIKKISSSWHWSRNKSCSCLCTGFHQKKKRLFRYKCKQIIIKILIKLAERCLLQFSLVRVVSSLDPKEMVQRSSTASLRFKKLADNLCTLNKISSKIVYNAKFEYGSFQSVAIKKHSEVFLTYEPRKERLDVFLGKYVRPEFENFWHICKAVFVFSYSQSFVKCDFQLTSWPLMTTCRRSELCHNGPVSEFTISGDLHKSCLLASQRYKRINSGKKNADISLNWSVKLQEIEVVNSKKAQQQESVDFLRKQVEAGMINADKNQDLSALLVATVCLQDARKKEKPVCELEQALEHLEWEYKHL